MLPGGCAGCGQARSGLRYGVCAECVAMVAGAVPGPTRPEPAPSGFPPCWALADYDGVLGELLVAYKDRGRHRLARPLGRLLAAVVAAAASAWESASAAVSASAPAAGGVVLVPIPDTPAAARARHGDHLYRLARVAGRELRRAGVPAVVARPLRALPRPDSAGLDHRQRAATAQATLRLRRWSAAGLQRHLTRTRAAVVLLDDVVTTGATLAAATARLAAADTPVSVAAVLAATQRRYPLPGGVSSNGRRGW
ncbi:ComF family protein [Natronosporangium hydrolyticum]|uniref:ComF family protein n=1 Tax=Natronosporangium hydrolyticum TaxID=2811111 RepID=A0A895YHZ7_9ACTN|nr:ComF family protein [Natronosporangium hydrolyticum]QSB17467.1 ComF family protein [Natronosporangium hydrolyticum]